MEKNGSAGNSNKFIGKPTHNILLAKLLDSIATVQFKRYVIVGILSFATDYLLLYVLTEYVGLWYIASKTIAFLTVFWINFTLNRVWSFKSTDRITRQLAIYSVLCVVNLVVSNLTLYFLTDVLGIIYLVSNVFVGGLVVIWNFFIYKKIIFK